MLVPHRVQAGHLLDDGLVDVLHILWTDVFAAVLFEGSEAIADVDEGLQDGKLLVRNGARHGCRSWSAPNDKRQRVR